MRDRLIEILEQSDFDFGEHSAECAFENVDSENYYRFIAYRLLAEGVIVQARGHWIETQREWDFDPFYYTDYQCSACGMREQDKSPFCRWCGTQMEAERSNENAE